MKIQKLTITPLENGCPSFFTLNPSTKDAAMMISQRLSHEKSQYNAERPARALRKMPKPEIICCKRKKIWHKRIIGKAQVILELYS